MTGFSDKCRLVEGGGPLTEQQPGVAGKREFSGVEEVPADVVMALFDVEVLYCRGELKEALVKANELMCIDQDAVKAAALNYCMVIHMATNKVDEAYEDYCTLKELCERGLANASDAASIAPYALSALLIESTLVATIFDYPEPCMQVEGFPAGMKVYFGYLLAMREMRAGRYERAMGITEAFQTLIGNDFPESKVFLHLVTTVAAIMLKDTSRAEAEFEAAWKLAKPQGIIMPFISMNFFMLGLPRRHSEVFGADEAHKIESMARTFRDGWFGLREKCGLSCEAKDLTSLECYTSGLAALGWSNKEIASWLQISENTVKHHLTSSYQKLHVSSRKGLREVIVKQFLGGSYEGALR